MMSVTLILPGDEYPLTDPYDIRDSLEHEVDLVIDGGFCGMEPTSVVDMTGDGPAVIREGLGDVSAFVVWIVISNNISYPTFAHPWSN